MMVGRHSGRLAVTIFIISTFLNSCYGQMVTADVTEDQGTGSTVYRFTRPPSGEEYSLFRSSATSYSLFKISTLGVVSTRKPLVFTVGRANRYDLTAVLRPQGETEGGIATTLRVTVKDIDNFPPAFGAAVYYGRVVERSPPDTVVDGLEKCFAEDRDSSGIPNYKIVSGNDRQYFKIETKKVGIRQFVVLKTTGTPIVRDPNSPSITLTVQAQQTGTTKIRIDIEDANDHVPVFEKNKYSVTVAEDIPVQTSVLKVVAKDEDVGTNGGVYYFLSPLNNYFMVDAITGVIKVAQPLDYSKGSTFDLTVYARDRGTPAKSSSVKVEIKTREDIRSYPPPDTPKPGPNTRPFFPEGSYIASIREDFPEKGVLLLIRAADNDPVGPNKKLTYSLSGVGSTDFLINPGSGLVTLAKKVDYKTSGSNKYSLTVTARDNNALSAQSQLTVDIQDVDHNSYAPQFDPQQLQESVFEDAPVKTSVTRVSKYVSDKDGNSSPNGKISYSIIQGSGMGIFQVDPNTGEVLTSAPLDREKRPFYDLVIKAEDQATFPKSSNLYLMISVNDRDDNNPYFTEPMYFAKVPEKRKENTFVTVVRAKDPDSNPSITYAILTSGTAFKIESATGVVRTGRPLDPTREKNFELIIEATSNNNKKAKGQLNVTVTSKADSPPEFKNKPYAVTVPENQGEVSDLLCIAAVDAHELVVKYSINGGSEFAIDTFSGRFSAQKSFDYEVDDRYKVQVEAVSGNSKKKVSTDIDITVSDEKDAPSFSQAEYDKITISEDTAPGTTINTGIRILDEDTQLDQFECSMEKITSLKTIEYLSVVQDGGECKIVTKKALDTFITPKFTFEMRATDKNFRNMFATAEVVATVNDKNNHDPVFSQSSYWVSVSSDISKDTSILKLSTLDQDQGHFGEVTFQLIQSVGSSHASRFSIDDNSGLVSSSSKLFTNTRYQLQAKAIDGGQRSATVSVYVSVYDTTDTPVKFEEQDYSGSVNENAALNTEVREVKATKLGSTNPISYELVGGYKEGSTSIFAIGSSSGKVTLIYALDRERQSSYKLIIRAKHVGGKVELATNVECTISVDDINDEAPKFAFDKDPKTFSVDNYAPADTVFATISAIDLDAGKNGKVSYSIDSSSSAKFFKIDADKGTLMTKNKLSITITSGDSKTFSVTIVATDGGSPQQTTKKTINVDVIKVHEPPKFPKDRYEVPVQENQRVGETVTSVKATYADPKAFLKYSFKSGNTNNAFCINKDGQITVARPLDREKVSVYTLKVEVARGNDKASTILVVKVTDINDDSPEFEKELYQFPVSENAGPGTSVGKIVANDHDEGSFGNVNYEVLQGVDVESETLFDVNKVSGVITTKKALDYEDIKQHVLFVRAEDQGVTKLSAVAEVRINVQDINDNSPTFSAASYRAKVSLAAVVGTSVVQVTATDLDSTTNGQVVYSIVGGNDEQAFEVNPENGLIAVKKSLTTVAADKFNLKVKAQDRGSSPKSNVVTVEINVFLPDGPPKFVVSPITITVTEGLAANQRVAVAKAATSEALKYEIISGNTNAMFKINPSTGEILTTRTLDYEEAAKYTLEILALDTRDRRAQVTVILNIVNINDNAPLFPGEVQGQIDRKVAGPFSKGVVVTRLSAIDKDVGDLVAYKMSPPSVYDNFDIDNQGQLIARGNLANIPSPYRFKITASDNGSPRNVHEANVRMVFVNYRPKQQPVRAMVPENTPVDSIITKVPKYFPTGVFSIIFPEKSNFTIDNQGVVRLTASLDFEKQAFHLITVREEQTVGKLTNDLDVEIYVIDLNDNKPYFTMQSTLGRVNFNSRAGSKVFQLSARDDDSGSNGLVGIQLLSPDSPFSINPFTKQLEVGNGLSSPRFYPKMLPFDYGRPSNNGTLSTIDVETSQTPPIFSQTSYRFSVSERAHIGKSIGKIEAKSVSGARLDFAVTSGDTNDRFKVKESGEIVLNSLLKNSPPQHDLTVQATEQIPKGLSAEIQVQIDVINANDFHPYFDKLVYDVSVPEDKGLGNVIETVKAYDCDCRSSCQCKPGHLKYSIKPRNFFSIDEDTGQVMISRALDYETDKVHLVRITAIDTGTVRYTAVAYLLIKVTDANDHRPEFLASDYEFRVAEDAKINQGLFAVAATDEDGNKVKYSVISGSKFTVGADSGVIELGSSLSAGSDKTEYTITIRARDANDASKYSNARVRINVDHKNSQRPIFTKCQKATVQENLPKGQVITTVVATDDDKGRFSEIEYSIIPVGAEDFFAINNRTGELTTITSLDRENKMKKTQYNVIIRAEDGGHGKLPEERLLTYCFLPVEIGDVNDNSPKFITRTYLATIQNTKPKGTLVLTVRASDDDTGTNAKVYYKLKTYSDNFVIESSTGIIRTKKVLTGTGNKDILTVVASNKPAAQDRQTDERERQTTVEIFISDKAPPKCKEPKFTAKVSESVTAGTDVLKVIATPGDGGSSIIRYSPVKANTDVDEKFSVSPSGQVTTASQLNYEALPKDDKIFRLQVRAQEGGTNLFSTCEVEITLTDVNDDKPSFDLGSYDARVLENAPVGTTAMKIIATDRDHGSAGEVTYSLKPDSESANFAIDRNTGTITTKVIFDREKKDKYSIVVIASDKGTDPKQLSEEVTVRIIIVDQNDQPPKFNQTSYTTSVSENAPVGTKILDLRASDKDIGDNALLHYFISGGDTSGAFSVQTITRAGKTYGILVVSSKLDFEAMKSYTVQVSASDGRSSDLTSIKINVLDVNDVAPKFQQPIYAKSIEEGSPEGIVVLRLTATDADSRSISYSLDSSAQGYFKIKTEYNRVTGVYSAVIETGNKKLDREASPIMMFDVFASDKKHIGKTEIKINLTDTNDEKPRFPDDQTYIGYVREGMPAGTSVMYVQAVDDDDAHAGGNAKIKYDLTNNANNRFKINADSALIQTLVTFNRDTATSPYTVTVRATDQGSKKQLTSTRDVSIYILDANTHKPEFTQAIYRGTVPENAPPGYRVAAVSATDKDIGPNAELEYVVTAGNVPHVFYLNPFNGTLHVSGIIDYEVKRSYNLTVTVADRGLPPFKADRPAYILITVTDTNDNAPVFVPNQYKKNVKEDVAIGTVVVKVTATDKDSGKNAKFDFSITGGNEDDLYEVVPDPKNPTIGLVRTRLPLDRETIAIHHLEITATDAGGLQGKGDVGITLIDVNDNGPWFVPAYFEGKIKENVDAAQFVTRLSAYDPDTTPNGGPFTYSIVSGSVKGNFKLVEPATFKNATSNMNSYVRFDREEKSTWKIGVSAVDSGKPKKLNSTFVYVDVLDDNDNQPFDGSMKIIVNAYKGKFVCGNIGKPYYKDDDHEGDINTYSLKSQSPGDYFTVNANGSITAEQTIPMGKYSLTVKITETNRKSNLETVESSISVLVRRIDPIAVENAVSIQFTDLRKVEYFVGDYYESVVDLMESALSSSVEVFSIQKAPSRILSVNVHFAAKKGDSYMKRLDVINRLTDSKSDFEKLGLKVGAIGIDECAKERKKVGKCINVVEPSSKCHVSSGDYGKVPAPDSSISIVSMDVVLKDKYVSVITPQGNCSYSNPCLHGGTCHDSVPYGFMVCECPRDYHGPQCQRTTRTFYGNSLIWLPKLSAYDIRDISFEFMTKYPDGLMLYQGPLKKGGNNGAKDFLAVFLRGGYVVVMVSYGSDPITINMTKASRLDDKKWHVVSLKRDLVDRKMLRVIIDKCEKATIVEENGRVFEKRDTCEVKKRVFGRRTYLSGFGPLQIGGVDTDISWLGIPTEGFRGCIRNIIDYESMYDLENPLKVVNSPTGCVPAPSCDAINCNNHGYCEPGLEQSICVCDIGYVGKTCSDRSPANYYLESSFSQFLINTIRAKRELIAPPTSLTNEFYTNIALKVKVDPDSKDCALFLSSNSLGTEFNRIDIKDHVIRYIFRLGDRMKVLSIPQLNITDGKYHTIVVKREGNYASMQIDYNGLVAGTTGGIHKLLNMGGGSFFSGGLPNITEVRVIEAIVRSGGNAILRTADGRVLASGIGTDGSGGTSFGSGMTSTLITVTSSGGLWTKSVVDRQAIFASGMGIRGVAIENLDKAGNVTVEVYNGRRMGRFGTAIGAQGFLIKNKYHSADAHVGGVPILDAKGTPITTYGSGIPWTIPIQTGSSTGGSRPVHVIGDFGGCTAGNMFNGIHLESDQSIDIRRQNVQPGCPCSPGFCLNGGTCINADPSYCICPPGWYGVHCESIVMEPNPGQRGSKWFPTGVLACMLVVILAIAVIMIAVALKRRQPPPVVPVMLEDGHVHDNIRPYHDEGAGEEDNFGYDITQLMKYTYIEGDGGAGGGYGGGGYGGGGGGYGGGGGGGGAGYGAGGGKGGGLGAGDETITVAEDKPLLQGAFNGNGQQFGVTTITRRRIMNADSIDVGNFIEQRVGEANGEYFIAHDSLHMFRYEGDDADVDDLSELGDSDNEDEDDEQSFDFLQQWGRKFDSLNHIYNLDD